MSASLLYTLWTISWQSAILTSIAWLVTRMAKKAPASWRYALWVIVLAKFLVPPFAYIPAQLAFWHKPVAAISRPVSVPTAATPAGFQVTSSAEPSVAAITISRTPKPQSSARNSVENAYQALALLWVVWCGLTLVLLITRILRQREMLRRSLPAGPDLVSLLHECASRLGVRRVPDIRRCDLIPAPMLVGLFRPVILIPSDIACACGPSDQTAILMHELAHVRRLDMCVLWVYQLVRVIFPFHPALWLAGRHIQQERELACDEFVLSSAAISSQDYAAGYVSALKLAIGVQTPSTALAMAEPTSMEKRRLEMILRNTLPEPSRRWLVALVVAAALGLPTFIGTRAMTAKAASTKPTVDDIAVALRDQESARGSLEVYYLQSISIGGKPSTTRDGRRLRQKMHYVWTPSGIRLDMAAEASSDGVNWSRLNGTTTFSKSSKGLRMLQIGPGHKPKLTTEEDPGNDWCCGGLIETTAAGLIGRPLYDQIKGGRVDSKRETVDGHECWKVVVSDRNRQVGGVPLEDRELTVWCDPTIGYAPRRLIDRVGTSGQDITFSDYTGGHSGFWFPMKVQKTHLPNRTQKEARFSFVVISLDAGKPIPSDRLEIQLP